MHADLTKIKAYIDSFRYGAHPHAGGGIGKCVYVCVCVCVHMWFGSMLIVFHT